MKITKMNYDNLLTIPLADLIAQANQVRAEHYGDEFELCSIINAKSGRCSENCKFCAQSMHHVTDIATYPLKSGDEIVAAAREAQQNGAQRFGIVTSGNSPTESELDIIAEAITRISCECAIHPCASLGALREAALQKLYDAGCRRYHHNIETSPRYYCQIVSTHEFEERLQTVRAAKKIGFEVCSGGIIGMGETWQDRIDMALLLKELNVDAVPLNMLVPIAGTPLESITPLEAADAIRTIALFRIILPNKIIKVAAGRESCLKDVQIDAFMAGATGMLIGGYLTVRGRSVAEDHQLVAQIKRLWTQ